MARETTFSAADYAVFGASLLISLGIGVYYACAGGRQRSTREFLMADKSMRFLPLSLSVLASFFSASTLLGTPAEVYVYGSMYWMSVLGASLAPLAGALLFGPLFFNINVVSVFQTVGMGIVLFGPSTALSAVTGLAEWVVVVMMAAVCTLYTGVGGLKAVVWTDVFQTIVMLAGILTVLVMASIDLGGWSAVWQICSEGGRIQFFDVNPDPRVRHTTWSLTLGAFLVWLPPYAVDQQMVQRFSAARTLRDAKIALLLNMPGMVIIITLCSLTGLLLYARYAHCDPLSHGSITNPNQLLPYFVVDMLGHLQGMSGLFVASLFSGALSSVSSMLSALSAVTWEDFLQPCMALHTDTQAVLFTKVLVLLYGCLGVGLAFIVKELGGTVLQASLTLNGAAGAPLVGLFILGAGFTTANWMGGVGGAALGLAFSLWISVGAYTTSTLDFSLPTSTRGCNETSDVTVLTTASVWTSPAAPVVTFSPSDPRRLQGLENLYGLSYLWFSGLGIVVTVVSGLLISWVSGIKQEAVPEEYQLRLFSRLKACLCCQHSGSRHYRVTTNTMEASKDTARDAASTHLSHDITPVPQHTCPMTTDLSQDGTPGQQDNTPVQQLDNTPVQQLDNTPEQQQNNTPGQQQNNTPGQQDDNRTTHLDDRRATEQHTWATTGQP
ncbi:sodium-coupled monocarboxylate transporter 1-like isoform X2 [Babylonia areolata]|uniref:sodium-coupled monocarboxylate transporter 1-like isoform X2 n=1 Tax=Babylonia areolata TaxID=304850 RepID=UPI003FD5BEFC